MSQNRALIQSLYDAFARGDAGTVLGAMAADVQWNEAEGSPLSDRNPYDSAQRIGEEVFGRIMTAYDGFSALPEQLVAEGETVVALGRYGGTHRASGQPLTAPFAHVWTVRDGQVVRFQQYTDTTQWAGHAAGARADAISA
jgi:uncharacterized protein